MSRFRHTVNKAGTFVLQLLEAIKVFLSHATEYYVTVVKARED